MTGSIGVLLGCWVSLDEQDRFCEVSVDRSAIEEVSSPSEQQIDSIFQESISESSILGDAPSVTVTLMSIQPHKLLNNLRNVLGQGATRE
ncbi:hypothetical protein DL98DRAFT_596812 [Cadophora sp. DSE1049]|nr:hypothetical protein DL98DRAFT_596812 [Cadophora sp. DSE1049]